MSEHKLCEPKHHEPHCPPPADPCADFCPTTRELCAWEEVYAPYVAQMIEDAKPDTSVMDALLHGITDYECDENRIFDCGDVIVYKGAFYQSRKNENDRHPHDSNAWKKHGSLSDMLKTLSAFEQTSILSIDYHASCGVSDNCKAMYSIGECAAVRVDTGEVDSCGNPIYADEYYRSLEDKNIDVPSAESESWQGPFTACDLFKTACESLQENQTEELIGG